MGLVWGLIETLVLTVAASPVFATYSNQSVLYHDLYTLLQLMLTFGIALGFLVGFIQVDAYKSMRAFLISKLIAIPALIGVLIYASPPFPPFWDPTTSTGPPVMDGRFLAMYIFGIVFVVVIGEVIATPVGAVVGESATARRLARSIRLTLTRWSERRKLRGVRPPNRW